MSKILTLSQFYYGHNVDSDNRYLDFKEGSTSYTALLPVGDYTLTEFMEEIAAQMTAYGGQTYSVVLNRTTRKPTISAAGTFQILLGTGTFLGQSAWPLAGFTTSSDLTGTNTYTADSGSGFVYRTQYKLFQYKAFEDYNLLENAAVSQSVTGVTQVVSFGNGRRMECEIKPITNNTGLKNTPWYDNATGIADARTFIAYITQKLKVEFMPDYSTPSTYVKCFLESAAGFKDGTGVVLKTFDPNFYTTDKLVWREVME